MQISYVITYKADGDNKIISLPFFAEHASWLPLLWSKKEKEVREHRQGGSSCGTGWSAISRKRHYPCSPYSNISNKLVFYTLSKFPKVSLPRISLFLCAVALQNSGLLVMLRRLILVLEKNTKRNHPCHSNMSVLGNNVTCDVADSRKHRDSVLAWEFQHVH